jgi:hypothetical protein
MCETHPIVVEYPATNLGENVASCGLKRRVDVGAALRACLDEEQVLLLRPPFPFLRRNLPPLVRQVALVAHEDARQVRVCMCAHVSQPVARVFEACSIRWRWRLVTG